MKKTYSFSIVCLIILATISCKLSKSQNDIIASANSKTPSSQAVPITDSSVDEPSSLCDRLKELKTIPYSYDEPVGDPIYDGLLAHGKKAIPCLIDKITDITPMHDPGPGPVVQDYRVGDAAVFMLLMITKVEWQPETMLSPEYAKLWKTEGIYAYFAYVEKPENRKKIQEWWLNWMKEHLDK